MARKITRRQFMTLAGASTTGAVLFAACGIPEDEFIVQSPSALPEDLVSGPDNWYATTCAVCDGGEGIIVRVKEGRAKKIAGNPDHPVNLGKQSVWCDSALQMLYHPDRLTGPMARHAKGGALSPISWEEAESRLREWVADSAGRLLVATGPERGHNAWVAQRFAEEFGGRHITFDPLEQGVLHEAVKTVFGQDRLPEFDIGRTRTLLSFGADFLGTWVSPTRYAVKYGEFRSSEGKQQRGTLIHVEPRMSLTAAAADRWIPIRPGMEGELALSIADVIVSERRVPDENINLYSARLPEGDLDRFSPDAVAGRTGVAAETIREIARQLADERPSLVIGGGPAGAHTNGSFNLTAIYALNVLVGAVGKKGGVFFNPDSALPGIPSSSRGAPFQEWEQTLADMRAGNYRTAILRGADIAYGLPRTADVAGALNNVPRVAAFATVLDDTAALADLVLPESSFLETWGANIPEPGPGYQVIGLQQPVVTPALSRDGTRRLSDSRGFGDTLLRIADGRLGATSMKQLVRDAAAQLHDLNLAGSSVKAPNRDLFWRGVLQRGGWWDVSSRPKTSAAPLGRVTETHAAPEFSAPPTIAASEELHLIPFASRALGDGRLAAAPWAQATPDPLTSAAWSTWAEINPETARRIGVAEGDVLKIRSASGEIEALAYPHRAAPPEIVAVPIGQGHEQFGRYAEGRGANVLSILADKKDSRTGALAWAATKVRVSKANRSQKIPKFEGTVEALAVEPGVPILVVRPGQSAEDARREAEESYKALD